MYDSMQTRGDDLTEPMSSTTIAERLSTDRKTIKDALRRMRVKGMLLSSEVKTGNGGWVRYGMQPSVRAEIFAWQRASKGLAKGQLKGQQIPLSSSSYINNIIKPTTAETRARDLHPTETSEWRIEDLDYSMLTEIGFGRSQVMQLRSLGLSFDTLQRSIIYFDFELHYTKSGKTIQEPLALFMKRMRENGAWPAPEEYEKRHAHFRSVFAESERRLGEKDPAEATGGEHSEVVPSTLTPAEAMQAEPWQ
jgi:hypothetical protein